MFVCLQRLVPQHAISRLAGALARFEGGPLTRWAIRAFIRLYGVDMREAAEPRLERYASFNAFFVRALAPSARPLPADPALVVSPADGVISQIGPIASDTLIQAKGLNYRLLDLCDGDANLADRFLHGSYATIYLAPGNYHRVHVPLAGQAQFLRYVPGALFSVNEMTTRTLPRLFARNERMLVVFARQRCWFALVMVGAMNVGSIELSIPRERPARNRPATYAPHATQTLAGPPLARGDEFGRFNLGSTVIVLASHKLLEWHGEIKSGQAVRMGEALGRLTVRR